MWGLRDILFIWVVMLICGLNSYYGIIIFCVGYIICELKIFYNK